MQKEQLDSLCVHAGGVRLVAIEQVEAPVGCTHFYTGGSYVIYSDVAGDPYLSQWCAALEVELSPVSNLDAERILTDPAQTVTLIYITPN